jgi:hypothetical protein
VRREGKDIKRNDEEMIAYALEREPRELPFAPALLADLDELGSDAENPCTVKLTGKISHQLPV